MNLTAERGIAAHYSGKVVVSGLVKHTMVNDRNLSGKPVCLNNANDIGNNMVAAKVHGNIVPPLHVLANAEVVEIVTYNVGCSRPLSITFLRISTIAFVS